ncbi:MAG: PrsW family intramembrane metalloprotease [Gloeomargaritaceae cyanobacterium C42_A2020_066]|nr:PrsW family intramembrane metalloprotease [Gloeomargaritaceae cyanobacterium C42_A2020_066]
MAFSPLSVLVLAVAPGFFWLWFFYRQDRLEPEPQSLVLRTFAWGVLVTLPILAVQLALNLPPFWNAVVVAPITEEYGKYWVVRRTVFFHREFDEPVDGIVYGAAAGLGLASLENVFYLIQASAFPASFWGVFWIRALLAVPGHALYAAIWGYSLGLARCCPRYRRPAVIRSGLALAMILHGLYNLILSLEPAATLGMLIFIPLIWRMVNRRILRALALSPYHPQRSA